MQLSAADADAALPVHDSQHLPRAHLGCLGRTWAPHVSAHTAARINLPIADTLTTLHSLLLEASR